MTPRKALEFELRERDYLAYRSACEHEPIVTAYPGRRCGVCGAPSIHQRICRICRRVYCEACQAIERPAWKGKGKK